MFICLFMTLIHLSAFILGCEVDTERGAVTSTSSNFLLVESLWELRRPALDLTEGDSSPYARRNRPLGGGGVEADGSSATLSS